MQRVFGLAMLAMAHLACSALEADLVAPRCERSVDCDGLNQRDGVDARSCTRWQCDPSAHVCRVRARDADDDGQGPVWCGGTDCDDDDARRSSSAREVCDGVDNNCDGTIDERAWAHAQPRLAALSSGLVGAWSDHATEGVAVLSAWDAHGRAAAVTIGAGAYAPRAATYVRLWQDFDRARLSMDDVCPVARGVGIEPGRCDFSELVTAAGRAGARFAAVINRLGCAAGQVRLGVLDDDGRVVLADSAGEVATGVDPTPDQACTGGSRSSGTRGARSLAIASLPASNTTPPRALLAWNAPAPACARTQTELLGAWLGTAPSDSAATRPVARAVGVLSRIEVAGDARPALLALPGSSGFLLATGDVDGGVALRLVPAFHVDANALSVPQGRCHIAGAGPASSIALAVLPASSERIAVGVAWADGCGATVPVRVAQVALSLHDPEQMHVAWSYELASSGRNVHLAAVPAPLRTDPDGDEVGTWVVTWEDEGTVYGARIPAATYARPEEALVLARDGHVVDGASVSSPQRPAMLLWNVQGEVSSLALTCGVPP